MSNEYKFKLTTTQLKWIISALQHDIVTCRKEMEEADDGSPIQSLGELFIDGRESLIAMLNDVIHMDVNKILIK